MEVRLGYIDLLKERPSSLEFGELRNRRTRNVW